MWRALGLGFVLATATVACGGDDRPTFGLEYQPELPSGISQRITSDLGGRVITQTNVGFTGQAITLVRRTDGVWEPLEVIGGFDTYSPMVGVEGLGTWSDGVWQARSPDVVEVAEEPGESSNDAGSGGISGLFSFIFSTTAFTADGHVFWAGRVGGNSPGDHGELWVHAPGDADAVWTRVSINGTVGYWSNDMLPRLGFQVVALRNGEVWLSAQRANPEDYPQVPGYYKVVRN